MVVGTAPLILSFPELFEVAVNRLKTVAEVWDQSTGNGSWSLNLRERSTIGSWI